MSLELWWPLRALFQTNPQCMGSPKLANNTILKANTAMYHFQPFLFPDIENLLLYQRLNIFFLLLFREMITCQLLYLYYSSKLHNLMDSWWSKINSLKSEAWPVSFFITSSQPKSKYFLFQSPLLGKSESFALQNVGKSKEVLVLKTGNYSDVWSPCKKTQNSNTSALKKCICIFPYIETSESLH